MSAQRLRECQGFIDKVGEIRFTKVKQRQLNKYNILLNKKEGNITRANATTPTNSNNSTNSNNLASQAGRQASASLPPGEGSNLSQTGSQAGTLLLCRALRIYELKISQIDICSCCIGELYCILYCVLRYTTTRLQVLFTLHHLGGITKGSW